MTNLAVWIQFSKQMWPQRLPRDVGAVLDSVDADINMIPFLSPQEALSL